MPGFVEMAWSAEDCKRMRKELGDPQYFQMMFQCGVSFGSREVVEYVLRQGMPTDAPIFGHGSTALQRAVSTGAEMVRLLLEYGASVNVKDWDGVTPLSNAIRARDIEVVRLLLAHGADPWNRIPWSDLRASVDDERTETIIQLLLEASAEED